MTSDKVAYELDYWQKVRTGHEERYKAILQVWGLSEAESVLEIGTGPLMGCLPYIKSPFKVGLDPLYSEYRAAGLMPPRNGIMRVAERIEEFSAREKFAAIISMNALDHGDCDFSAINRIAWLLEPRGRFYLHVHLRRPDQLNVGHDHALRLEDLERATKRAGLKEITKAVHESDPIEGGAYRTVIGVWEK